MNIVLKECNNKLIVIDHNNIEYIFSYDSLIGIFYKGFVLFDQYYINYSNTTNKHINYIKNNFYSIDIIVNSDSFNQLKDSNFNKDQLDALIKNYNDSIYIKEYIKDFKLRINSKDYDLNDFYDSYINLKHHIELIKKYDALKLKKDQIKELKTVTKHYLTYKVNNIEFTIIKTYSNNKNKTLKNIKVNNLKTYSIKLE